MQMKNNDVLICGLRPAAGRLAELMDIRSIKFAYDMGKAILNSIDLKGIKKWNAATRICTTYYLRFVFHCQIVYIH